MEVEKPSVTLGKFKNEEQLLQAYKALESEFTKRCQIIKELEKQLADTSAELKSALTQPDFAVCLEDEEFVRENIFANERLKDAIVAMYLEDLCKTPSLSTLPSSMGRTPLSPIKRPKTLLECKALAEKIIY